MSVKFKPGDLVEVLPHPEGGEPDVRAGMIGTIISYYNDIAKTKNKHVVNAWTVKFPTLPHEYWIQELYLRLVPGGEEYRDIGKWDQCYYDPYKIKEDA